MNHLHTSVLLAHAGPVLVACVIVLRLLAKAPARWRWLAVAVCAAGLSVRVGDLSAAEYFRGAAGDFSVTTILLLGVVVWRQLSGRGVLGDADRKAVLVVAAIAGLLLYPPTLWPLPLDPYELGYRPTALLAGLFVLAILARVRGLGVAVFIPLVVLAWVGGLMESANLWDYIIDPYLAVFGVAWIAASLAGRIKTSRRGEGEKVKKVCDVTISR